MAMAAFQALPFSAYRRIPLRPLTNCIKQLTIDAVKHNCNLLSNNILFTRRYLFRYERTIIRPYRNKAWGFTINDSCVGARIQRLYVYI